jgi:hypothetical protein
MGVRFYLYFDSSRKYLYVSLPAEKVIIKLDPAKKPIEFKPVAGNGQSCRGNGVCGDESKALEAKLSYPKVITIRRTYRCPFLPFWMTPPKKYRNPSHLFTYSHL